MYARFADVYDAIYGFKNYAEESAKLVAIVKSAKPDAKTLLDVACGTGAHLQFLKESFHCVGVDLSDELLQVARKKLPEVSFVQDDMRTFDGEMRNCDFGRQFDVITCLFSAIAYMLTPPDLNRAIANMARHLAPGGVLIIEPWFDQNQFLAGKYDLMTAQTDDMKIARANTSWIEGNVSAFEFHFLVASSAGVDHFTEVHRMGLFSAHQYVHAFESAGLKVSFDDKGLMGRGLYVGTA